MHFKRSGSHPGPKQQINTQREDGREERDEREQKEKRRRWRRTGIRKDRREERENRRGQPIERCVRQDEGYILSAVHANGVHV